MPKTQDKEKKDKEKQDKQKQDKEKQDKVKQDKQKEDKEKKEKEQKRKERKALVGRVKKAVDRSRRKLNDAKFEKELQRTIAFLNQLQSTIGNSHGRGDNGTATPTLATVKTAGKSVDISLSSKAKPAKPAAAKAAAKPAKKTAPAAKK
jgi:hypothetical protein